MFDLWRGVVLAACFTAAVSASSVAVAQKPNPNGQPADLQPGKVVRYYVWYDEAGWHLRTTTVKRLQDFDGRIRVVGGTVENVIGAQLEGGQGERSDRWKVSDNKRNIAFRINTQGAMDGFDFTLSEDATDVEFTLKVNGEERADHIFIGKNSKNPPSANFSYRAKPRAN